MLKRLLTIAYYVAFAIVYAGFLFHRSERPQVLRYTFKHFAFLLVLSIGFLLPLALRFLARRYGAKHVVFTFVPVGALLVVCYWLLSVYYYHTQVRPFDPFLQAPPPTPDAVDHEKPPHVFRILVLGGSTTENRMLAREHKYPSVLQSLLRERYNMQGIDVFNAGRSWYTTKHSLINYVTNLRDWQPDLVLVMHAVNDLNRSFSSTEFAIGPYNRLWSHYYGPAIRGAKPPTFTQHLVARYFSSFFFVWYSDLRYRQRDYPLDHFISVTDFERYLRRLVHHIRDDGRQSVLITQPFLYKERMTPDELRALRFGKIHCRTRSGFLQEEYPSPGSLRTAMDAFNDVIRRVARTEGVPLADAEARIEKNLENFTDDVHYTVIGARRLATAIAETIIEQGLIRPGKQGD